MKKLSAFVVAVLTIVIIHPVSYAITGDEALAQFRGRMNSAGKITGIISWSHSGGETYTGAFKYMSPGKIYVKFSSPSGKTIVSNGKSLWIYSSGSNIC
jgi:outer membrane lipoprotein-sorting protein